MRDKGLKKEAGCSWIEIANRRHVFVAGDICYSNREEIYEKLGELDERCRRTGHVPMTELMLRDVDEIQKVEILSWHSEKLAVSFTILMTGNAKRGDSSHQELERVWELSQLDEILFAG